MGGAKRVVDGKEWDVNCKYIFSLKEPQVRVWVRDGSVEKGIGMVNIQDHIVGDSRVRHQ